MSLDILRSPLAYRVNEAEFNAMRAHGFRHVHLIGINAETMLMRMAHTAAEEQALLKDPTMITIMVGDAYKQCLGFWELNKNESLSDLLVLTSVIVGNNNSPEAMWMHQGFAHLNLIFNRAGGDLFDWRGFDPMRLSRTVQWPRALLLDVSKEYPTGAPLRRVIVAAATRNDDGDIAVGARHTSALARKSLIAFYEQRHGAFADRPHKNVFGTPSKHQGFIDNYDVFHSREAALHIALAAGQPVDFCAMHSYTELRSEGLY